MYVCRVSSVALNKNNVMGIAALRRTGYAAPGIDWAGNRTHLGARIPPFIFYQLGMPHSKLAASLASPRPLYIAACG